MISRFPLISELGYLKASAARKYAAKRSQCLKDWALLGSWRTWLGNSGDLVNGKWSAVPRILPGDKNLGERPQCPPQSEKGLDYTIT